MQETKVTIFLFNYSICFSYYLFVGTTSENESAESQDEIEWLKNNNEPWPEIIDKWKKTLPKRQLVDKDKTVLEILNTYPAFRKPLAYTLVSTSGFVRTNK